MNYSFQRLAGVLAIEAGILALTSLAVGVVGVDYSFDVFSNPVSLIAVGSSSAIYIRWSYWLNMVGNYLFLVPLALFFYQWLKPVNLLFAQLFTFSGLLYLTLGAAGSAIFAASWPILIELYASVTAEQQLFLVADFIIVNVIAGEGFHGVLQDLVGAIWFLGIGHLLRTKRNGLGIFTMILGGFLVLNTMGNLFNLELLSLVGLAANIIIGPLWSIVVGAILVRST